MSLKSVFKKVAKIAAPIASLVGNIVPGAGAVGTALTAYNERQKDSNSLPNSTPLGGIAPTADPSLGAAVPSGAGGVSGSSSPSSGMRVSNPVKVVGGLGLLGLLGWAATRR